MGRRPIERGCKQESRGSRRYSLADEGELARIRRSIRSELSNAGVEASIVFDCLVAVTEACSNALRHGHGEVPPQLSWALEPDRVRFYIQDYSRERWSRTAHPSRPVPQPPAEDRTGGFGLELMQGLMDSVEIRSASGGTTVELTKQVPARAAVVR
ncbi:MAG: ATP-binding protein [Actinomycetota bacterium]